VEQSKYLLATLTDQSCIQEETKCRLKTVNACYHWAQNPLSSILLSSVQFTMKGWRNWQFKN